MKESTTPYEAKAPSKTTDQLGFRPKRFWKTACVFEAPSGFEIHLDKRPVKTPMGEVLRLPNAKLADLVCHEWQEVGEQLDFESMPLTRLGFASVDSMDKALDEKLIEVLRYAQTDHICYPSDYPQALIELERKTWLPILDWVRDTYKLYFIQNTNLIHIHQPVETIDKIEMIFLKMTPHERAGVMAAIPVLGSVVLSLALFDGHLSGEAAFKASRIAEDFQEQTWGKDVESAPRLNALRHHANSLEIWFKAIRS